MSVLKNKRKESKFEVIHNFYVMRKEVTNLLLRDFGYNYEKSEKKILKTIGYKKTIEEMTTEELNIYQKKIDKNKAFINWFIVDERNTIMNCLRQINQEIFLANDIRPIYMEELTERRLHQDNAIGYCECLMQELQYVIETLPVNVNVYFTLAKIIDQEIALLKKWRRSDNKIKGHLCMSSENFANVNNNGNANENNASNANGVRPDFEATI